MKEIVYVPHRTTETGIARIKEISITYTESVFVALGIQYAKRVRKVKMHHV